MVSILPCILQPGGPAPADHSYIAASYVKFLEVSLLTFGSLHIDADVVSNRFKGKDFVRLQASGGRAVPFEYDLSPEEIARRWGPTKEIKVCIVWVPMLRSCMRQDVLPLAGLHLQYAKLWS